MRTRLASAVLGALIVAALGVASGAQQPDAPAVTTTLLHDVEALAAAGAPFGIVMGKDDAFDMQIWRAAGAHAAASPEAAATRFRGDWRNRFRFADEGRVLSAVSTRASVCVPALERSVAAQTVTGTPVEVLFAVMREVDPSLRKLPPPGVVSGGGSPSSSPSTPVFRSVTVEIPAGTLRGALDAIVASARQLGWMATERCSDAPRCRCDLGFVTPTDAVYTSYDAAAGSGAPR